MRLGIMQPYFFPYLGHFALIANVDRWIVFDVTQYTPKAWMNRNRILHPKEGWQYITAPIANSSISLTTDQAVLADKEGLRTSVLGKLSHYKKTAPFYRRVVKLFEEAITGAQSDSLVSLNVSGLRQVCEYLEIPFRFDVCSALTLALPQEMDAGDWAPTICGLLGADEYLNPIGGRHLFSQTAFEKKGVTAKFLDFQPFTYPVAGYAFEGNLSILDVLMWNSPTVIKEAIRENTRIEAMSGQL